MSRSRGGWPFRFTIKRGDGAQSPRCAQIRHSALGFYATIHQTYKVVGAWQHQVDVVGYKDLVVKDSSARKQRRITQQCPYYSATSYQRSTQKLLDQETSRVAIHGTQRIIKKYILRGGVDCPSKRHTGRRINSEQP